MPVTLCFIKDKHKVMEHKILLEHYCPVKAGKSVFEIVET